MKNIFLIVMTALLCGGCALSPGFITVSKSAQDNSTQIQMKPATLDSVTKVSLAWDSTMKKSDLMMTIILIEATSIGTGNSLQFEIDGELFDFESIDQYTKQEPIPGGYSAGAIVSARTESSKRYVVSKQLIEKILNSKQTRWKIKRSDYLMEGIFPTSGDRNSADNAFRKFLSELEKNQGQE